jgi:hypothetical protein
VALPADIEDCVRHVGDKADNAYALCNWMKSQGKGYFAHAEGAPDFDVAAAVREFAESGPGKGARLEGVEAFRAGRHKGHDYGRADLERIARNFHELKGAGALDVPAVLGHEEDQEFLRTFTGLPAAGWVESARVGPGRDGTPTLFLDFADVSPEVARWVRSGHYRYPSVELYPDFGGRGLTLRRVALLGGEQPDVKGLAPLPEPSRHSERPTLILSFAEESLPVRDQYTQRLGAAGFPADALAALSSTPEADYARFAEAWLSHADAPPADRPDRDTMIADLVAAGQDANALAAMDDEALYQAWMQVKGTPGGAPVPMSEPSGVDPVDPVPEPLPEPRPEPPVSPQTPPGKPPKKVTTHQYFSEGEVRAIVAQEVRRQVRPLVVAETASLRQGAARREREEIYKFCERLAAEGRVDPAELDEPRDGRGNRTGPLSLPERLLLLPDAQPVRRFSEGGRVVTRTARRLEMDRLAALRPRRFAERVPGQGQGPGAEPVAAERVDALLRHTPTGRALLTRREQERRN